MVGPKNALESYPTPKIALKGLEIALTGPKKIKKKTQMTLIPKGPHMIVIAHGPDSTIPEAYLLTLVILVLLGLWFLLGCDNSLMVIKSF